MTDANIMDTCQALLLASNITDQVASLGLALPAKPAKPRTAFEKPCDSKARKGSNGLGAFDTTVMTCPYTPGQVVELLGGLGGSANITADSALDLLLSAAVHRVQPTSQQLQRLLDAVDSARPKPSAARSITNMWAMHKLQKVGFTGLLDEPVNNLQHTVCAA